MKPHRPHHHELLRAIAADDAEAVSMRSPLVLDGMVDGELIARDEPCSDATRCGFELTETGRVYLRCWNAGRDAPWPDTAELEALRLAAPWADLAAARARCQRMGWLAPDQTPTDEGLDWLAVHERLEDRLADTAVADLFTDHHTTTTRSTS